MRKFTFFLALMVAMVTTTFAQVDYKPKNFTQTTKQKNDRPMTSVVVGNETYALTAAEQLLCYVDKYDEVTFTVTPGQKVSFVVNTGASWVHNAVYIDFDNNGFTAGVTNDWEPTGDLVSYSFYNNGSSSDASGWNSVGNVISGDNRNRPAIPSYTIPEDATPGEYRIRFTQDWCSIDPDGDADGRFGDFYDNRGAILDAKLVVSDATTAKVEYTYIFEGETIGNASYTAFVGEAYPEPINVPFGYYAETPAGLVEGDITKEIVCVVKLPFEYAESVDAITTWYYIQMHSNNKKYIQYVEGENSIEWADAEVAEGEENSHIWAFVGTPANGFKLVNYAATVEKALCSNGEGNPAMGAYADGVNWLPVPSDEAGDNYFCLQYPNGNYMNAQNGKIAYWNDNDAGSTFVLTVAKPVVPAVPVTFDIYALDDVMNPSPLEGTVSSLGIVAFVASNNKAVLAKNEAADAPKVGIFDPAMGGVVAEASSIMFGDLLGNGMQLVAVQFDGFATPGSYMVYAPAGAFTVNGQPSEEIVSAQFTIPAPVVKVFEVESVTPADKKEVEAINKIEINFTENIRLQQDPATYDFYSVNLVDENNNVIVLKTSDDNIWSKVVFTPAEPITAAGTYTLDLSQIKLDGGVCEGSYSWTVVEPVKPLEVVSYTPTEAVEKLETITITFSDEIEGQFDATDVMKPQIYLGSKSNGCSYEVNGNVLTITPFYAITTAKEYALQIPAGVGITRKATGEAVEINGDIVFTVKEASTEPAALEATNATRNPAESEWDPSKSYYLQGVKLEFAEAVKKADGVTEYGCIYNANGEQVAVLNKVLGANGTATYATPYVATKITTAGTYKVVVYSGVILSADGTKEYKGGEFEFTVAKKPATLIPSAEDGLFYNASFTSVDEFKTQQIVVSGADEVTVSEEVNITMTSGENVYTATVIVEDNDGDKVINIVFPDKDYAAGSYTINIPAGAFLVDGVANAEYYPSTFTYRKPQLKITKDWTSWEAFFTEKYMMPREVAIAINNAESVTVAEGVVATLTVGETTYNSTVSFTSEENNYWITFKFAEIQAIYEDENKDFVKGEYTFTVPGGLYTVNGEANVEETKTFTYGAAVVEEFSVASISPAVGNVTELSRIEIAFSNGVKPEQLILTNGDERFFFIAKNGAYVAVDPLKDYAEITITEPGTYTLDLSELDGLTGDNVFSWTIPAPAPTLNETVVFDFANNNWGIPTMAENNYSNLKVAAEYTDGTNTIYIDPTANNGSYIYDSKGFLNLGKTGSKIVLPAFDFAVEKIEVVGHSSATSYPNVDMNVYVGDVAVSTACIGSTATSTFAIAADNQAAGNVYELVIGSNGGKTSSVMYITYIKVYPAENKLEAPVIDLASGVYVGEQTVNAHSATTDIEGVTDVTYYYTTDGNEPTVEDEESVDGVITITNSCTLKVIVEFTLGDKTYVSASTSAEYIITEEVTYHRAVAVETGNYFLVADGKVAAPIEGTTLPAVEVAVDGNDATAPVYYAITLEVTAGGCYIKDVNGNYIYTSSMYGASGPKLSSNGAYVPMSSWTITIADDENSTATIVSEKLTLVYDTAAGVFKVTDSVSSDMILPTLYGTYATGINEAVVNGEAIESIYDLTGRKIEKITKSGIYIVNGKKVLVK